MSKTRILIQILKLNISGVPAVAQDQQCLGRAGTQVQSLVQHSGLRIQHWCGCGYGSDLIPGPGTPYAVGWPKKKKERKTERQTERTKEQTNERMKQ